MTKKKDECYGCITIICMFLAPFVACLAVFLFVGEFLLVAQLLSDMGIDGESASMLSIIATVATLVLEGAVVCTYIESVNE